jgi:hypothetical protein
MVAGNTSRMSKYAVADYTFNGLDSLGEPTGGPPYLAYLVGLADSQDHKISDPVVAKRILGYLYEIEEQKPDSHSLLESEARFLSRMSADGFRPQTPCMVTKAWSPIGAMLELGLEPVVLRREPKIRAAAASIWEPHTINSAKPLSQCTSIEELFWGILNLVSLRGKECGLWVSVIAKPGWYYESAIGSLPHWPSWEVEKAGRIIWQRTPEG